MKQERTLPGLDVAAEVRASLAHYSALLRATGDCWVPWHERRGVAAPAVRSLEAEACVASFVLFRQFYDGLVAFDLLPICFDILTVWRRN